MNGMSEPEFICSRCETPLEAGDLRCSICGQAAPSNRAATTTTEVTILRCKGCGASMKYDPNLKVPACAFCDSRVEIETITDPMEQTEGYLAFTISPDQAEDALQRWLRALGWFRPSDLSSASRLTELQALWWPAWIFDTRAKITWAADSNFDSRRSSWAPHSGTTHVNFERIVASASRGLSLQEVDAIVGGLQYRDVHKDPVGVKNATVERFEIQRSQARQQIASILHSMSKKHVEDREIPGTRFRNVHLSVVVEALVTQRLSLPAYVLAYRYRGRLYRVVICGQHTEYLIGKAPYSTIKIVFAMLIPVALLLMVLLLSSL